MSVWGRSPFLGTWRVLRVAGLGSCGYSRKEVMPQRAVEAAAGEAAALEAASGTARAEVVAAELL